MAEPRQETHIPWIGQIPESWAIATLKRTTYLKGRIGWQGLTTDEYRPDGDYLLVTGTDFEAGRVQWSRCPHVDEERHAEDPHIQLREKLPSRYERRNHRQSGNRLRHAQASDVEQRR